MYRVGSPLLSSQFVICQMIVAGERPERASFTAPGGHNRMARSWHLSC